MLQAVSHMDVEHRLDPKWLATLDRMVRQARAAGLSVFINEYDFTACSDDPGGCLPKLTAFCQQIGTRFKDAPDSMLFELLNEPHGKLDATQWNLVLTQIIPVVRATNPRRKWWLARPTGTVWPNSSSSGSPPKIATFS
ncbi:cellulase family glycosylhydrolase [Sphingomonas sp. AAP5]|uniref:cellulase family glycosylhydrolase n=1 Tax=Sphingomonas sp. AAP5 TaxID=1523415 RepID=UPI001F0CF34B|nr:cellulase family glycosylhydrolase [Sphingomonas sp. AAP5]